MFTLKLYQNGPLPPEGRTVIMETVGVWIDECGYGVKHIYAFRKRVGVMDDEAGTAEFYVGGDLTALRGELYKQTPTPTAGPVPDGPPCGLIEANGFKIPGAAEPLQMEGGRGGNYFSWGVLENAQGKTTEMFR